MILDLPLGADAGIGQRVSAQIGLSTIMYYGRASEVRPRDLDRKVFRVTDLKLRPFNGRYRLHVRDLRTNSNRLTRNVCWHGHREWMRGVLAVYPDAVIRSGLAVYYGVEDFESRHESTKPTDQICLCEERK